jgi:hypothetical protein
MDYVTFGFLDIRSEVGETSLWAFANLETGDGSGSFYVQRDLQAVIESSEDGIRLFKFSSRGRFVGDGELVRFAGTSVLTGTKVGDVHGLPNRLLCIWIVKLDH